MRFSYLKNGLNWQEFVSRLFVADRDTIGSPLSGFQTISSERFRDFGLDGIGTASPAAVFQMFFPLWEPDEPRHKRVAKKLKDTCRKLRANSAPIRQILGSPIERLVLVIPEDPDAAMRQVQRTLNDANPFTIDIWGEAEVTNLLMKHMVFVTDLLPPGLPTPSLTYDLPTQSTSNHAGVHELPQPSPISRPPEMSHSVQASVPTDARLIRLLRDFEARRTQAPLTYLTEALDMCQRLANDPPQLLQPPPPIVAMDFSELHVLVGGRSEHVPESLLVTTCLKTSPWPIALPPGAVFELMRYVKKLHDRRAYAHQIRTSVAKDIRAEFINQYEQDEASDDTFAAYQAVMQSIASQGIVMPSHLGRLQDALSSAKLVPIAPEHLGLLRRGTTQSITDRAYRWFSLQRGHFSRHRERNNHERNVCDAQNLSLCVVIHGTGAKVVLVSSAVSMKGGAHDLLTDASLVRDLREYMIAVQAVTNSAQTDAVQYVTRCCMELRSLINALTASMSDDKLEQAKALVERIDKFAPFYRTLLRPVDELVEATADASRGFRMEQMNLVASMLMEGERSRLFRDWWGVTSAQAEAIAEMLSEQFEARSIEEAIEIDKKRILALEASHEPIGGAE